MSISCPSLASLWRLAVGLALLVGMVSCQQQVQGSTTPPAPVLTGPMPGQPTGSNAPTGTPAVKVEMTRSNRFYPDVLVVRPGDIVEWTNNTDVPHSVTNDPAAAARPEDVSGPPQARPFDSGYVLPGQTFRYQFTEAGEYRYACFLHEREGMTGTVLVMPQGGP